MDQWVRVESQRLLFIQQHQKDLKAEKYDDLCSAIREGDVENAGVRLILPPTYKGSPRDMSAASIGCFVGIGV
jgi:hypothetical protein